MSWYKKTAILVGCGFLLGAEAINLIRVLIVEHTFARILPHLAVMVFTIVIVTPVIFHSKDWFQS
jgi:hypothetical protein